MLHRALLCGYSMSLYRWYYSPISMHADAPKTSIIRLLRWSEKYTKTDMVYLFQNGFWLVIGQFFAVISAFGLAVAFGHLASQDTYGNYKFVLSIAGLLGALSLSGLTVSVAQSAAKGFDGALKQGKELSLRWSFGITTVAIVGALYYSVVAQNYFLSIAFVFIAIFLPWLNAFSLFDPFLVGKKDFARETIYSTLNLFVVGLAIIFTLLLTHRAVILIAVYFIVSTLSAIYFYILTLKQRKNDTTDPGLFKYSGYLSIMNFIGILADRLDSIIIFFLLGPSQLGVYVYAIAMPEQFKALVKNISPLAMPKFSERPIKEIRNNLWKRTLYFAAVTLFIMTIYAIAAPILFRIFFPVYIDSVIYSQWYAFSIVFVALLTPFYSVFQAHKKTKELYLSANISSAVLLLSLPLFIWLFGIPGALASQFIYRALNAGLSIWQFNRAKD